VTPITAEEFATILQEFPLLEDASVLAVACSGGPDSLALTLLLHAWAQSRDKEVIALTVDHGLRSDSAQEGLQVQQWLSQRGISHEILLWHGEKPQTRIQETAREMRYHLLSAWCQEQGIPVLLTAHHAQDQAETFLMRLAKGSGLRGLCAIRSLVERLPVKLVRPLLTIPPQRLRLTLEHFQQPFIEDPSNENRDFERVRWRQTWQALTQHGLTLNAMLTTIGRLQESQSLIDAQLSTLIAKFLTLSPHGYLIVDWKGVQTLSVEATELFLADVFWLFSDQNWRPKHEAVKALCLALRKGQRRIFTLGGTIIQVKGQQLLVFRELRAAPPQEVFGEGTQTLWWDGRFLLNIEVPQGETLTLKPLGSQESLPAALKKRIPSRALVTVPSFWRGEDLFFFPAEADDEKQDGSWRIRVHSQWKFTLS
jgi:tRNA(Ile)-lysidine synthase